MVLALNSTQMTVRQTGRDSGRYLLFIRSGSSYPLCLETYAGGSEIIVVLSLYQEPAYPVDTAFWVVAGGLSKFDAARLFFAAFPHLLACEGFAFFDPDVGLAFGEIGALFDRGLRDGKSVFQASVAAGSSTHWEFLRTRPGPAWREVSFIEVMAPFFARPALLAVLDGFSASLSTWGLEYHWYARLRRSSMAVYNPISMRHEAAVDLIDGPFYRYLASMGIDPFLEKRQLKGRNVGRYFLECDLPGWVPLRLKSAYVYSAGALFALKTGWDDSALAQRLCRLTHKARAMLSRG